MSGFLACSGVCGVNGSLAAIDHRTAVAVPAAFTKRNALRPLKVALAKPDGNGVLLTSCMAGRNSGCAAVKAAIFAGSG